MSAEVKVVRCDFCSVQDVDRSYRAISFVVQAVDWLPGPQHASEGDWAACSACGALIDAERWEDLVHRTMKIISKRLRLRDPIERAVLRDHLSKMFDEFRRARL